MAIYTVMTTKLSRLLSTFSPREWSEFRKYLGSQVSSSGDVSRLYEIALKKRYGLHHLDEVEIIRLKHFPSSTQGTIVNAYNKLSSFIEDWMAIKEFQSDALLNRSYLVKAWNRRGLYKYADKEVDKMEKKVEERQPSFALEAAYRSSFYHNQYYSDNPVKYDGKGSLMRSLVSTSMQAYKDQSLLYLAEMVRWEDILGVDFSSEIKSLEKSIEGIATTNNTDIYMAYLQMLRSGNLEDYLVMWELLRKGDMDKAHESFKILTLSMVTATNRLWSSQILKDPDQVVTVYNFAIEEGAVTFGDKITKSRFYAFLSSLGLLKDFKRTQAFIDKWIDKVDTDDRESVYALAMAQNCFYCSRYNEIHSVLIGKTFIDYEDKGRGECLRWVAWYYDKDVDYYYLLNTVNNFMRTLKRNQGKLSEIAFQGMFNFATAYKKIIQSRFSSQGVKLNTYRYLLYRNWIMQEAQKVNEKKQAF